MANSVYQSPVINTQPKRVTAYTSLIVFLRHLLAGTGGYAGDFVSIDNGQTTANIVTLVVTQPIPAPQLSRYSLTLTGLTSGVVGVTATAIYQSPPIVNPNAATKRVTAYTDAIVFLEHLLAATGGYGGDIVSLDFGVTLANVVTLLMTQAIPVGQLPRYSLTRIS